MTSINKIKHGRKMDAIRLILIPILFFMNLSILSAETSEGFDHFSTGFPLTGKHEFIDCSSCHIGGQARRAWYMAQIVSSGWLCYNDSNNIWR